MKTRILLVEDDDRLAKLTAEYLQKNDFEVTIEARGDTAETRILSDDPDLVILDIMLPDVSGYQIVQELRADPGLRDVRVLMMTARGSVMERRKGLALGADGFIAKPFELAELRAEMARVLGARP